jgi:hypothetical protein
LVIAIGVTESPQQLRGPGIKIVGWDGKKFEWTEE